jgi:hypothetical protein
LTESTKRITIGFSIHRPEIIGITADLMERHKAIFLEEPPAPGLRDRLRADALAAHISMDITTSLVIVFTY